ncbi:hypothetical protein LCGC14_1932590 [marine sediment metagenome]|uniref:ASCH domain-containing protein n=1 Tax=marine sediment metagenome TaxID=412755 RepID=A0A0F9FML4_9ZZZZ
MKPILFSTPMVKAILEDRKSQTRRVLKPEPWSMDPAYFHDFSKDFGGRVCPYGQVGGEMYVRETHNIGGIPPKEWAMYRADYDDKTAQQIVWHPSIFMPRWASRITLEVVSVRVERVQEISRSDALAEGFTPGLNGLESWDGKLYGNSQLAFEACWESINAKRGYGWETNCWVWVLEFKRVENASLLEKP